MIAHITPQLDVFRNQVIPFRVHLPLRIHVARLSSCLSATQSRCDFPFNWSTSPCDGNFRIFLRIVRHGRFIFVLKWEGLKWLYINCSSCDHSTSGVTRLSSTRMRWLSNVNQTASTSVIFQVAMNEAFVNTQKDFCTFVYEVGRSLLLMNQPGVKVFQIKIKYKENNKGSLLRRLLGGI